MESVARMMQNSIFEFPTTCKSFSISMSEIRSWAKAWLLCQMRKRLKLVNQWVFSRSKGHGLFSSMYIDDAETWGLGG